MEEVSSAAGLFRQGAARLRRWRAERLRRRDLRAFARRMLERDDHVLQDLGLTRYLLEQAEAAPERFQGAADIRRCALRELSPPAPSWRRPARTRPLLRLIIGGCASPGCAEGSADAC